MPSFRTYSGKFAMLVTVSRIFTNSYSCAHPLTVSGFLTAIPEGAPRFMAMAYRSVGRSPTALLKTLDEVGRRARPRPCLWRANRRLASTSVAKRRAGPEPAEAKGRCPPPTASWGGPLSGKANENDCADRFG
jgi:hypothetical protein